MRLWVDQWKAGPKCTAKRCRGASFRWVLGQAVPSWWIGHQQNWLESTTRPHATTFRQVLAFSVAPRRMPTSTEELNSTGQHLITAIFERDYNFNTLSWSLGQEVSYIELSSDAVVTQDCIDTVERVCNELIAAATPVAAQVLGDQLSGDVSEEVWIFHVQWCPTNTLYIFQVLRATRGLPKDHVGDVRVITIQGVESNMCCGTHVTNLAQLNCIKLLNIEKTKNRQFLHFLVGDRVLRRLKDSFDRECKTNLLLKWDSINIKLISNDQWTKLMNYFCSFVQRRSIISYRSNLKAADKPKEQSTKFTKMLERDCGVWSGKIEIVVTDAQMARGKP